MIPSVATVATAPFADEAALVTDFAIAKSAPMLALPLRYAACCRKHPTSAHWWLTPTGVPYMRATFSLTSEFTRETDHELEKNYF